MLPRRVIISGPSGSGKSTIINYLLKEFPSNFKLSISHTTRKKRDTETNHQEYHFVTKEEFLQKIQKKEMFEYQIFNNEYYGTSFEELNQSDKSVLFDLGRVGVEEARNKKIEAVFISIFCSREKLKSNLIGRIGKINCKKEDFEDINRRLEEFDKDESFFKSDFFDYFIVDSTIEQTKKDVCRIFGL